MSKVNCKCDVYHQRVFHEGEGRTYNTSLDSAMCVFFEIVKSGRRESRYLVLTNPDGTELFTIPLNKHGGLNPLKGHKLPTGPIGGGGPVDIKKTVCETTKERIFYTDTNLSADERIKVFFIIDKPKLPDEIRKLMFVTTDAEFLDLNNREISIKSKKPLESGPYYYFESFEEYQAFEKKRKKNQ